MIAFDTITLIISASVVFIALLSALMNPLLHIPLKKKDNDEVGSDEMPPLSVIIRVGDDVDMLERNIKLFFEQQYEPGFQIIIVANEGDNKAEDLVKLNADKVNIKSTFIPNTSRYLSRGKLGVTLGVKAADNDWCILTNASCYPVSDQWLKQIGKKCHSDNNIVIGYSNYDEDSKVYQRFISMRQFAIGWLDCLSGIAYSANSHNIAFRKSEFIGNDGYRGNLDSIHGEYDFLVNKLAKKGCTAVISETGGRLTEKAPFKKEWHRKRMYSIDARQTMKRHFSHSFLPVMDNILLHLSMISSVGVATYGAFSTNWILLGAAALSLILLISCRTAIGIKASRYFNAGIPAWAGFYIEISSAWHTMSDRIRYRFASKTNFTSHKL